MSKVRLIKGPFGGKVMNTREPEGTNIIRVTGTPKLTREQRYEFEKKAYAKGSGYMDWSKGTYAHNVFPIVEAEYQLCIAPRRLISPSHVVLTHDTASQIIETICMHPDGSFFYEFTGNKKIIHNP